MFWVPVATWYRGKNRVLECWVQAPAPAPAPHVTLGKSLNPSKPLFSLCSIDQPTLLGAFSVPSLRAMRVHGAIGVFSRGKDRPFLSPLCTWKGSQCCAQSSLGIHRLTHCPAHFSGMWRESGEVTAKQILVSCYCNWMAAVAADVLCKAS